VSATEAEGERASTRRPVCEECLRLKGRGRAAVMANDQSRLADVWLSQLHHDQQAHSAAPGGRA
jgi:hypothetical protein